MLKKRYKNKGVPVKGPEMRLSRNIRLSDSAWNGLDEAAEILKISRADLLEWWTAVITNNEKQLEVIAKNEGCSVQEVSDRVLFQLPILLRQSIANQPPPGFPMQVKPTEGNDQQ